MNPHYFQQDDPDADDMQLDILKGQGYVPQGCLLGGFVVMGMINNSTDPCKGCEGPRDRCGGRSKE